MSLNPTGSAFYLRLDADGQHLDDWDASTDTGSPNQSVLLTNVSSIAVTDVAAGTTLTVDFAAGDPLVPSGLTFTGIAGAANTLNVSDAGDAANTDFNVEGSNVDVLTGAGTRPVKYANLKLINVTPRNGTDALIQVAQPGAALSFLNTTSADAVNVVNGTFAGLRKIRYVVEQTAGLLH